MGRKAFTLEYLNEVADQKNFILLSSNYTNAKSYYKWSCKKCRHVWLATFENLKREKTGCPKCGLKGRYRFNIEECHAAGIKIGAKCLDTTSHGVNIKYSWQCNTCGHIWRSLIGNIKKGQKCPKCQHRIKINIETYHIIAHKKGFKFLSDSVIDVDTNHAWQCLKCNYIQKINYYNIQRSQGCKKCTGRASSKPENEIREFVSTLYPDTVGPIRSILSNKRFELDIYVPSLRSAIEFDGVYWHSFEKSKLKDQRKDEMCAKENIALYRVKELEFYKNKTLVFEKVKNFLTAQENLCIK